jgi:NTP pyrophosphatase (non-canonical NTP hydrolase)
LSLSLQDAQHVSWKIFRKIDAKLDAEGAKRWNPLVIMTDLLEEVGEVSTVVKGLEGAGHQRSRRPKRCLRKS